MEIIQHLSTLLIVAMLLVLLVLVALVFLPVDFIIEEKEPVEE